MSESKTNADLYGLHKELAAKQERLEAQQTQDKIYLQKESSTKGPLYMNYIFFIILVSLISRSEDRLLKKINVQQKVCSRLAGPKAVSKPSNSPRLLGMRRGRGWHFEEDAFVSTQLKLKRPEATLRLWERRNKSIIESKGDPPRPPLSWSSFWYGHKGESVMKDARSTWKKAYDEHIAKAKNTNSSSVAPNKKVLFSNEADKAKFFMNGVPTYSYQFRDLSNKPAKKVLPFTLEEIGT